MKYLLLVMLVLTTACVSLSSSSGEKTAPKITKEMPLKEVIAIGIEFGGDSLIAAKREIKSRNEWDKTEEAAYNLVMNRGSSWPTTSLVNTVELLRASNSPRAFKAFKELSHSDRVVERQLAWQLAADLPSEAMAHVVETRLTQAIAEDELKDIWLPRMGDAVANNKLIASYSVVSMGLFETNDVSYAKAMIALQPKQASIDFLDYLAKAPIEELRQLNMQTVNVYVCTLILHHYASYPPPASDARIETLFLFSISRNNALADMARDVLESYLPINGEAFSLKLASLPAWMQLAFVERANQRMTPNVSLFLDELKKVAQKDVVEEIGALRR